jgi:cell division protein ZapE
MLLTITQLATNVDAAELIAELVPPKEFASASFASYRPDPNFESQAIAAAKAKDFVEGLKKAKKSKPFGIYFDGGFGVGKTHLLASCFHSFRGKKLFGSFLAFTSLIGALGFAETLRLLKTYELICIDEFELDDPGDTMMMSRLLKELSAGGTHFAATSNTPPNALGQGRFAAADFAREIAAVADSFEILRIEGEDFRHRASNSSIAAISSEEFDVLVHGFKPSSKRLLTVSMDDLLKTLSGLHPSRYTKLCEQFDVVSISDLKPIDDQSAALRFVTFVDRCYEAQVSMVHTGIDATLVFLPQHLAGGFSKKYLRSISRLAAMHALPQAIEV